MRPVVVLKADFVAVELGIIVAGLVLGEVWRNCGGASLAVVVERLELGRREWFFFLGVNARRVSR